MRMFDSYDNLSSNYIPNNSTEKHVHTYSEVSSALPRTVYSAKGQKIGLSWDQGEEFDLHLNAAISVLVSEDALIYNVSGEAPSTTTKGYSGQQAYNTYDHKSWTCIECGEGWYIWKQDAEIMIPDCGTKEIIFHTQSPSYLVCAKVYNFRWESIYQTEVTGADTIVIPINKEFNELVKSGTYYCVVTVQKDNEVEVVGKHTLIIR